jgi:ribonuclease J
MQLTIHRGTKEIGGSCVEIEHSGSRIILDLGIPLVWNEGNRFDLKQYEHLSGKQLIEARVLPNISGLYKWSASSSKVDGLLISHAHLDHYGFVNHVRDDIFRYLGEGTKRIIDLTNLFLGGNCKINNFKYLRSGDALDIGSFKVTPYLMDHSAFDAYAFLIEGGDKRLLYSGDFRDHGRKSKAFYWFLRAIPKNIDTILLEGSLFGREDDAQKTEEDIEKETFAELKKSNSIVFCIVSGQNIDRLVSFYKAALRAKRLFVIDVYTANVLESLKDLAKLPYPSDNFKNMRVFYPFNLCNKLRSKGKVELMIKFRRFRITKKEISENLDKVFMIIRQSMLPDLSRISGIQEATVIYSMWEGYLKDKSMERLLDFMKDKKMHMIKIHTSSHAAIDTLKKIIDRISPKSIIPIHTFYPEQFKALFNNVMTLRDRQKITI